MNAEVSASNATSSNKGISSVLPVASTAPISLPQSIPSSQSSGENGKRHGVAISFYAFLLWGGLTLLSAAIVLITHAPHWTGSILISLSYLICAAFTIARLRKLERTFRVLDVPIVWGTVVLFALGSITCILRAFRTDTDKLQSSESAEKSRDQVQTFQEVKGRPFDITTQNVGPGFQGDNIAAIITQLKTIENKDEFESTAQYQARLAAFRAKPISGATTSDGYLAFVQQDMYDGDLASWEGASVRSEYNADKRVLNIDPDLGMAFNGGPIVDKAGPGLDLREHFSDPKKSSIQMSAEQAKDLKYVLKILFVCRLAEPWIHTGSASYRGSSGGSMSVDLLNVRSVQVWIFDDSTGQVLLKQTLMPLRKSRR